jgi:choline-sulfatase
MKSTPAHLPLSAGAILALSLCLALGSCSEASEPDSRSALLITLDTTRWDALGCYDVYDKVTPVLDRIAEESVVFETAYTVTPITLPAHASMLTGLYPLRHGIRDNGFQPLPASAHTLAESVEEAGHQTAAFVSSAVLDRAFGLDQGFEVFRTPQRSTTESSVHFSERLAPDVVEDAVRWLRERDRERPFFLWVHLFDPHVPYQPPVELRSLTPKNGEYYGEVAFMDRSLGVLFDELRGDGTLDRLTVLVVGDHGESLKEHREETHSFFCYDSTLRVPFLIRYPDGYRAGERSREIVSVVDVEPTLREAMGQSASGEIDGRSLFRRIIPADRGVYFESYSGHVNFGWSPITGWVDSRGKYIHSSSPEYYRRGGDLDETENVFTEGAVEVMEGRRAIAECAAREVLEAPTGTATSEKLVEALQGLGYVASGPLPTGIPHPLAETGLPSPVSMVDAYYDCQRALAFLDQGQLIAAKDLFEKVLERNPKNWLALDRLALCFINMQRPRDAVPILELLVQEGPQRAGTYYNLGLCYSVAGRRVEAIDLMKRASELDPAEPIFLRDIVKLLREEGLAEEAREYDRELRRVLTGG